VDQITGSRMSVPTTRRSAHYGRAHQPLINRTYFVLFANPGKKIKTGDKVTVAIGQFRVEDIIVE